MSQPEAYRSALAAVACSGRHTSLAKVVALPEARLGDAASRAVDSGKQRLATGVPLQHASRRDAAHVATHSGQPPAGEQPRPRGRRA